MTDNNRKKELIKILKNLIKEIKESSQITINEFEECLGVYEMSCLGNVLKFPDGNKSVKLNIDFFNRHLRGDMKTLYKEGDYDKTYAE